MDLYQKRNQARYQKKGKIRLFIVTGAPTLFYQQVNQNSYIISSLASALHYMGDEYASKYIIKRMQKSLLEIHNKGWMHFCHDILMGHHREKNKKTKLSYWGMAYIHAIRCIAEWVYLSNCVFANIHVAPDLSLY